MKRVIKKYNLLDIVLIISPIIDIATSVLKNETNLGISIGSIVRGVFLVYLVIYMLINSKYKHKKANVIYLIIITIYAILFVTNTMLNKEKNIFTFETSELIKAFYFPICIITLLSYKENDIKPKLLFWVEIEYITLLFIPFILKMGYTSYIGERVGSIGFFFSANEISSIYAILFPFIVFSYERIKNKIVYFGVLIFCLYTIMQMGTKIPAISAIICIFGFTIIKIIQNIHKGKTNCVKFTTMGITLTTICVGMIIFSPIYENLNIYKEYLISARNSENIVVESEGVVEILEEDIQENEQEINFIEENIINTQEAINENIDVDEESKLTGDEIATIIHSGRIDKKNRIEEVFNNANIIQKILGLGRINKVDNTYNLSEIDYYDILFNFGYLGSILYFMPIITILYFIIKKIYLIEIKHIIKSDKICSYLISILVSFLLCAIAGHTLIAPAVSIFIAIILVQTNKELEILDRKE